MLCKPYFPQRKLFIHFKQLFINTLDTYQQVKGTNKAQIHTINLLSGFWLQLNIRRSISWYGMLSAFCICSIIRKHFLVGLPAYVFLKFFLYNSLYRLSISKYAPNVLSSSLYFLFWVCVSYIQPLNASRCRK